MAVAALFTAASAVGGLAMGTALGALGSLAPAPLRFVLAMTIAVAALPAGLLGTLGVPVPVPQRERETPQRWLDHGAAVWSVLNGVTLGTGVLTRIEFPVWFAVPLTSLLAGDPAVGALVYGSYGLARAALVWPLLVGLAASQGNQTDVAEWLFGRKRAAHRLSGWLTVLVGSAVAVAFAVR